jgi:hypothetical protein
LADRVGVDRSAVAYWVGGGGITLDNLAQVLIEFKSQWSDLPIPARQELAAAAYAAALSYTRGRLDPAAGRKELDREGFWCLFHLFSELYWEQAVRHQDPVELRAEADRVLAAAGRSLGSAVRGVTGADDLRELVRDWGLAWVVGIGQVPTKWVVT